MQNDRNYPMVGSPSISKSHVSGAQKWRGTFAYIATPYCDFTRFQYSFSAEGACENRNIFTSCGIFSLQNSKKKYAEGQSRRGFGRFGESVAAGRRNFFLKKYLEILTK